MRIIFLGAPGAGKGTQAEIIAAKLNIPTVSTGNIIREALKNGTEMGLKAKAYTEAGKLVPDDVVIGIIKERLAKEDCKEGFILDGFPRTVPQAEALETMGVRIDKVIEISVPDEDIKARLGGRRVCESCGATYHIEFNPPKVEGKCDKCGGNAVQRKDDAPETVIDRLKTYHEATAPLVDFYKGKGKLKTVYGQSEVSETTKLVLEAVNA